MVFTNPYLRLRQEKGWSMIGPGKLSPSGTAEHTSGDRTNIKKASEARAVGEERSCF